MRRLTGYFDNKGTPIREGDLLKTGMRRGDSKGWTIDRVEWDGKQWTLVDLKTGERMQFQYDEQLRVVVNEKLVKKSKRELQLDEDLRKYGLDPDEVGRIGWKIATCLAVKELEKLLDLECQRSKILVDALTYCMEHSKPPFVGNEKWSREILEVAKAAIKKCEEMK